MRSKITLPKVENLPRPRRKKRAQVMNHRRVRFENGSSLALTWGGQGTRKPGKKKNRSRINA